MCQYQVGIAEDTMKVGFIGLGAMGRGMASRLMDAGNEVHVWNRSPAPCEDLARHGAHRADSPAAVFISDAVITMLADDDAVRATIFGGDVFRNARKKPVHIVMSTLSVSFARELERAHIDAGIAYVAAPVMGRPDVAAAGKLNILAAGDPAAIERVRPLFDVMGQKTWRLGKEPHQANVAKLAMNFLLGSAIEAMAEAAALVERYDIEPTRLMEIATGTLFAAPAYNTYDKPIAERQFKAGFRLTLGLKDIRLALAAGEASGVPLPFASVVRDNLIDAVGHGDADKDWSALALVARRRAELQQ
jgi:3-hydroxyisobutyrate dehydrogenase-like beta-hydroxyacid dehydrogenase